MTSILVLIAITSFWVLGLTIVTQEGMLLHSVRTFFSKEKAPKINEAIITCVWCMPSIHSLFGYLFCIATGIVDFEIRILYAYPIIVCGSSLVCGLIWLSYEIMEKKNQKLENEVKYYDNIEQLTHWDVIERKKNHHHRNNSNQHKSMNHER